MLWVKIVDIFISVMQGLYSQNVIPADLPGAAKWSESYKRSYVIPFKKLHFWEAKKSLNMLLAEWKSHNRNSYNPPVPI